MNGLFENGHLLLTPGKRDKASNVHVSFEEGSGDARATVKIQRSRNGDARCTVQVYASKNSLSASIIMRNASAWVRVTERSPHADMEVMMGHEAPPHTEGFRTLALIKIEDLDNNVNIDSDDEEPLPIFFQIFVRLFNGKSSTFRVHSEMLVKDLKLEIKKKHQLPPDQQRLLFAGKQLEDYRSFGFYEIGPNATLNLVSRLRGG
ncbi:ubiquitin [Elysia marginata]|uniref:Ubiquitin n=1 Tax=Elysia marginata TaxID=1093978 RepID=A0AAV4FMP0_9GAST|nr:ubiquitin [Elysia marginata]